MKARWTPARQKLHFAICIGLCLVCTYPSGAESGQKGDDESSAPFNEIVLGPDGKLWLIGNPVYVNWDSANGCEEK